MPKVSVCIPTYNSAPFLAQTIDTILSQTFNDFELIIIDDASRDETVDIIRLYAEADPRIVFIRNERNLGLAGNFNRCLELAQGELIKYVLADDYFLHSEALSLFVRAMEDPKISLAASGRLVVDKDGIPLRVASHYREGLCRPGIDIIRDGLFRFHNSIGEPTAVIFRRSQAKRGFDSRYRQILDLEMWFHLLEQGRFFYLADPLVAFRVHDGQMTQVNKRTQNALGDSLLLIEEWCDRPYVRPRKLLRIYLLLKYCRNMLRLAKEGRLEISKSRELVRRFFPLWMFYAMQPVFKVMRRYFNRPSRALRGHKMRRSPTTFRRSLGDGS